MNGKAGHSICIVGAGVAGLSAAKSARAANPSANVTLITQEASLPYWRPDLSKRFLATSYAFPTLLTSVAALALARISLLDGWGVEGIDLTRGRLLGPRAQLSFDRLVLAPGAVSAQIALPGAQLPGVRRLRTLADARALRSRLLTANRVVVIGGGLIGLEIAANARRLGKAVTIVERAPHILSRCFPAMLAAEVGAYHATLGVEFHLATRVEAFLGRETVNGVMTSAGQLAADLVIVATGAKPDTQLATAAGIDCNDGIIVDEHCRTSAGGVWAAGDATRVRADGGDYRLENWRHADEQGQVAGANAAGADVSYTPAPWFWSDQGELHLQGCGTFCADAEEVVRPGQDGCSQIVFQRRAGTLSAAYCLSLRNALAKDLPFLARLVAQRTPVSAATLTDPAVPLKTIWREHEIARARVAAPH